MLKGLKGVFFEDAEAPIPKVQQPVSIPTQTRSTPSLGFIPPAGGVSSGKFKDKLVTAMQAKLAGGHYLKFQQMNTGMKARIADVATRCTAVGAALELQGITKASILADANSALTFLEGEGTTLTGELDGEIIRLDQDCKTQSDRIAYDIDQKQKQIVALNEEITSLQKDKMNLEVQTNSSKSQIEVTKIEFAGCLNSVLQEIRGEINEITTYVGG